MEGKKVFMGVAQIMLDDLDLSNIVIGWYKLFGTSSLVSLPPASGAPGAPAGPGGGAGGGGSAGMGVKKGSMQSLDSFGWEKKTNILDFCYQEAQCMTEFID